MRGMQSGFLVMACRHDKAIFVRSKYLISIELQKMPSGIVLFFAALHTSPKGAGTLVAVASCCNAMWAIPG
jgi:hypothetical protein